MHNVRIRLPNCTKIGASALDRWEVKVEANTQDRSYSQLMGVMTLVMAPIVTALVCEAIVGRWRTFGWMNMVLAVVLVSSIVGLPLVLALKEKTWGRRLEVIGAQNLYLAYIWLMLATRVFSRL